MKKTQCDKCNHQIKNCNFGRHYLVCDGKGPYAPLKQCKWCERIFDKTDDRPNHVRWCSLNPNKDDYNRNPVQLFSKNAREKAIIGIRRAHRDGKYLESFEKKKGVPGKKHTEETKSRQSEARKNFLGKNPDAHPWKRNKKFHSVSCENVKNFLRKNEIPFEEEFRPLSDRFYAIDIAFPSLKIGIEINGNQHYNANGTLKKYYQDRHNLIVDNGWTLLEIHYSRCFDDYRISEFISQIILDK